jgi:formylglycine-generating enzyme required for sulfatase activity
VAEIFNWVSQYSQPVEARSMKAYTNTIPAIKPIRYVMVPIPGGEFLMGSPSTEKGRKPDEGPVQRVKIEPFWMGKHEVTWDEYDQFIYRHYPLTNGYRVSNRFITTSDAVSGPTSKPFIKFSFGEDTYNYPAVAMTPKGASRYCMWLSALKGEFYRLPTEAEWEYACRAGATTAFAFGDDATKLDEYGWYEANSPVNGDWRYHQVGTKKPNRWGLHDMHGNVAEWCLDQYVPDYNMFAKVLSVTPVVWPIKRHPRVIRGGAFDFEAAEARSAARMHSKKEWETDDPQWPLSGWWYSRITYVGFRIVRPLKVPTAQEMQRYWLRGMED